MNGKFTFLKAGLVGLFLIAAFTSAAQISDPGGFTNPALSPATTDAIFCSGNDINLEAGATNSEGVSYTEWRWDLRSDFSDPAPDAGFGTYATTTTNTIAISGLAPGYHAIRVFGKIGDCWSDDFNQVVIYVLPSLNVTVTAPSDLTFCVNAIPETGVTLNANITEDPTVAEDFTYNYSWWKINVATGDRTNIGTDPTSSTYTLTANDYSEGEWIYGVDVSYNVDASCGPYSSYDGTSGGINVIVTPAPEAPTITIVTTTTP